MAKLPPVTCRATALAWGNSAFADTLGAPLVHEPEQIPRHPTHLDLFGALGNAIPPMMAVNVLERLVARIAHTAVHLHGSVRRLTTQPIGPIVAHGYPITLGKCPVLVHGPCCFVNEGAEHFTLRMKFYQRKLNGLIGSQRLAEWLTVLGILNRLVDAVLRRPQAGRRLTNSVLVEELLNHPQPPGSLHQRWRCWAP